MKAKNYLLCLISFMFCFGAVGCSYDLDGENSENGESGSTGKVVGEIDFDAGYDYSDEITVWVSAADSEVLLMNSFVGAFNEVYPNIKVQVQGISSLTNQLVFNAGLPSMCDVFWVSPESISTYTEYGIIAPLSPIVEADASFDTGNLLESCVENCSDGGTLYVMPRDYNQVVMYYNVDMFDAAGVSYPSATEAMTQAEFLQMLADLKEGLSTSEETNSYGLKYKDCLTNVMDASILWDSLSWPIIKSFGGKIFDENGNHLDENGDMLFDSEETYEAYLFAHDLVENGYMGAPGTWSTRDGTQFMMETAPVYLHCRAVLSNITTASGAFHGVADVGVAPFPDLGDEDTYYVGSGATGYAMYSGSSHKTAAWLFLKFIVSERAQEEASKSGNLVPVVKSLLEDESAEWRKYANSALGAQYSYEPFVYRREECFTHVRQFMQYVDPSYQSFVFERIQNCYTDCISNVKSEANKEAEIRAFVKKYAAEIKRYVEA